MKRWMILALTLSTAQAANAGFNVSTFEDLNPTQLANFVNNNAGPTGQFISGGNSFNNSFDPTFGAWSGFSISSQTDVANPGIGTGDFNYQYLAATGMRPFGSNVPIPSAGANSSLTYAVANPFGDTADPFHPATSIVNLAAGTSPISVQVTNTAYDVLSMTYGDGFAHAFGTTDFLELTIQGYSLANGQGSTVGSELDFFLASNGTIVTTWQTLDLSRFAGSQSLAFGLESSDNGEFGINTPAEFALDNFTAGSLAAVPEPSSLLLCLSGIGIGSLIFRRVRPRTGPL
jgi:hypothetical protein